MDNITSSKLYRPERLVVGWLFACTCTCMYTVQKSYLKDLVLIASNCLDFVSGIDNLPSCMTIVFQTVSHMFQDLEGCRMNSTTLLLK